MIQFVFVFGVVLPTLITVACFIGFLVCWFRFRSMKRRHADDRKSSGAACPRRCRVYVATADDGTCSHRSGRCFWPPAGSSISTGSCIPAGLVTYVVDQRRSSVVLPLTSDGFDTDMPSTAKAEVGCTRTAIKHPDSRQYNFRSISGLRSSTTLPGLLPTHRGDRKIAVSDALLRTGTGRCLSNAGKIQPATYVSGIAPKRKGGRSSSQAVTVDACYVDVEPIIHASDCPTDSCVRPKTSVSTSVDDAVSKATRPLTTISGLSGDRKYCRSSDDDERMLATHEIARLTRTCSRHHSLTEVPHHGELQIKTGDDTSLDF